MIKTNPQLVTSYSKVKAESFSSKIRNKTRMSSLTVSIQYNIGSPRHSNQVTKKGGAFKSEIKK